MELPLGCPNFALKKFRFEAKLSETETVSLRFASVSQNHKKSFASFRFVSFALFRYKSVSLRKFRFKKKVSPWYFFKWRRIINSYIKIGNLRLRGLLTWQNKGALAIEKNS